MMKEITGKIVTEEVAGRVILYDIELREKIQHGEAKRTLPFAYKDWGWVYVDLDEKDMPLAVTLIVNKNSIEDRKANNEKN